MAHLIRRLRVWLLQRLTPETGWIARQSESLWVERWADWLQRAGYPYDWTAYDDLPRCDGCGQHRGIHDDQLHAFIPSSTLPTARVRLLPPSSVLDRLAELWWERDASGSNLSGSGSTVDDYRWSVREELGG